MNYKTEPMNELWQNCLNFANSQRKLLLAGFMLFDAYLGLANRAGLVAWTGLFDGDLIWMLQSVEMMLGGLLQIHNVFSFVRGK